MAKQLPIRRNKKRIAIYMIYGMVTFTINIPQMLAYIPAPWILWLIESPEYFWNSLRYLRGISFISIQQP